MADISSEGGKLLSNGLPVATESQVLGVGQTWQDVVSLRALSTTYTNNTGKPIQLSISGITAGASASYAVLVINGVTIRLSGNSGNSQSIYWGFTEIIPDGATYKINPSATAPTLQRWAELR